MLYSLLFLLAAFESLAQATEGYSLLPKPSRRRQSTTCDQTYGNGSIPCGGLDSPWCYNPNLGQTCCPLDSGFCNDGSYCAPVAGYCCFEDEDLASCAQRAGFDLPNVANYRITDPSPTMTGPMRVSRTFTVTPFLTANPVPTPTGIPDSDGEISMEPFDESFDEPPMGLQTTFTVKFPTTCHQTLPLSASVVVQITNASASRSTLASISTSPSVQASMPVSTLVHVSVAVKQSQALIGPIFVVAIASVFVVFV
ncbi:hypothetical protein ANO14919_077030 [Xylariales sp. No.14919]|nr:hypothetical protein ANO14919_077030 [Xylariales sp. No.14919]